MLNGFDWLRRCKTGAELLATLRYLEAAPDPLAREQAASRIGPPHSALDGPCQRCWIYPRATASTNASEVSPASDAIASPPRARYCKVCQTILDQAWQLNEFSSKIVIVWGFVNRMPPQLEARAGFYQQRPLAAYIHDEHRFLLMLHKRHLRDWLQELVLYHGTDLTGLIQIFPPTGARSNDSMGDILVRVTYQEMHAPPHQLQVRFYAAPYQVSIPRLRERQGVLAFEVAEFLSLLEMAAVFRAILRPEEQTVIRELLTLEDAKEEGFYWGRLQGQLSQEAKDMLSAWRIRAWPKERLQLLYDLANYVYVDFSQAR